MAYFGRFQGNRQTHLQSLCVSFSMNGSGGCCSTAWEQNVTSLGTSFIPPSPVSARNNCLFSLNTVRIAIADSKVSLALLTMSRKLRSISRVGQSLYIHAEQATEQNRGGPTLDDLLKYPVVAPLRQVQQSR